MKTFSVDLRSSYFCVGLACIALTVAATAQLQTTKDVNTATELTASVDPGAPSVTTTNVKPHTDDFIIGSGDVLAISVWKQPDISQSVPVRSDGRISMPLIGEVQAAGQTPQHLEEEITSKLRPYLAEPEVTVIVEKINSQKFNVLGKVAKPGAYPLTYPTTVLDAIALAGGCKEFAKHKSIYILRTNADGSESRLPFNYENVIKGKNTVQNVKLQPHDTVVIP
jgi:polysaccharide export outer membrane protein